MASYLLKASTDGRSSSGASVDEKRAVQNNAGLQEQRFVGVADLADLTHSHNLHRGLMARHITMIALGGALGTGLIIGSGAALAKGGPASILISYTVVGFVMYLVMCALGEMGSWLPLPSGFTGYATRFCDPSLGFALGWIYWMKYAITTSNQLTAAALVIQYWIDRERVNPGVWITVFIVVIVSINYFGIKYFGEFEFWLSGVKVITICGLILLSLILALGGGPDHDRKGFRYWRDPGAFHPYIDEGATGNFLAVWSTFVTATFSYLGTELVGVTIGEAQSPSKTIPRAVKLTFARITCFYILSIFLLGMLVPYNSKELAFATKQSGGASASPFVVAIVLAGIPVLPHIINASLLVFVFSASNTDLYICTRTLYGLACEGKAPAIFARTNKRGTPVFALAASAPFTLLAMLNVKSSSTVVFGYFVNVVTIFGILTWISILITHIWFVRARKAQDVTKDQMAYVAPLGIWGSYGALAFCCIIALFKNFDVFVHGHWNKNTFITGYIGIPVYLILIFGYKLATRIAGHTRQTVDLFTGKAEYDAEEEAHLAAREKRTSAARSRGWFYKTFLAWLL
ncbi:amino acid permease Dip5 [Neolentinus lepideus HHB14362 ss-1]|uniref:Amino acid permease Dip5 n=1 Tax=Neolentinus lepideus HHB14362 ss-1 TaxID=1314782 RepID=A0A165T7E9_9AGAM|nr:amino acid permease Dip5 [Neolentinus lepideus HHB14362 ss-1]